MSAVVPIWVLFMMLGLMPIAVVVGALVWGNFKEKRALGQWDYIRPVYDLTLRPHGPMRVFFVETFHDGRISFPASRGKVHVVENRGVLGWFGGTTREINPDEMVEVDGILFYGRTQFEQLFKVKMDVLHSELKHYQDLAGRYQHLAEQRRHDPQYSVDQAIDNLQEVAKASMLAMAPKPKKGGHK